MFVCCKTKYRDTPEWSFCSLTHTHTHTHTHVATGFSSALFLLFIFIFKNWLYGFFLLDSGMTEKDNRDLDLFGRQGLIGGLRVPVLWHLSPKLLKTYHEMADVDVGYLGTAKSGIPPQESVQDIENAVWAAKYLFCTGEIQGSICRPHEYNGTCWIDRPDVTPPTPQKAAPGGRARWHPGNRYHQLKGRTIAFTLLTALHELLTEWSNADHYALPDDAWHVTSYYQNIRTKIRNLDPHLTGCGKFEALGLMFLCTTPMKVRQWNGSTCPIN